MIHEEKAFLKEKRKRKQNILRNHYELEKTIHKGDCVITSYINLIETFSKA